MACPDCGEWCRSSWHSDHGAPTELDEADGAAQAWFARATKAERKAAQLTQTLRKARAFVGGVDLHGVAAEAGDQWRYALLPEIDAALDSATLAERSVPDGPLPCGHPASAVVGDTAEGTFYCGDCAKAAETAAETE